MMVNHEAKDEDHHHHYHDDDDHDNDNDDDELKELEPFQVTDVNIIQYREAEELRRLKARKDNEKLKIWDKGGHGRQIGNQSRAKWIKSLLLEENDDGDNNNNKDNNNDNNNNAKHSKKNANSVNAGGGGGVVAGGARVENKNPSITIMEKIEKYLAGKGVKEEKESLPDFIAKKKELFLLQLSLNIKKEEIEQLDDKIRLKEEALQKSEKMLEEDALRFDVFLKENDKKAQEAWREAEKETKKKMEKIQEIKRLNQQLQILQSTINKYRDNLDECLQYKKYLDQLTPKTWVEQQTGIKKERQLQRRKNRIEKRQAQWKKEQEERIANEQKAMLEMKEATTTTSDKRTKRRIRRKQNNTNMNPPAPKLELPPMPNFEDEEPLTSSDEDIPMYFSKPQQILEIFSSMEEENLFLIQNAQEAEQSLDEMTCRFRDSKREVQQKVDAMQENINQLKNSIMIKQEDIKVTMDHLDGKNSGSQRQDDEIMQNLTKKVKEVYHNCGFNDAGSTPSTLFMLSEIEASMEETLSRVESMPLNQFKRADKLKEKKRREAKRAQQQAEQALLQEERNRKVIERSMQPPKKPNGKKVSFTTLVVDHCHRL